MALLVSFAVGGWPKTKGSVTALPGVKCRCSPKCKGYLPGTGRVRQSVEGSTEWALRVKRTAQHTVATAYPDLPAGQVIRPAGGVSVHLTFWQAVDDVTIVREGSGDCDKLERNILDALTGVVYRDDVQVVKLGSEKHPATHAIAPGVLVRVFDGRV